MREAKLVFASLISVPALFLFSGCAGKTFQKSVDKQTAQTATDTLGMSATLHHADAYQLSWDQSVKLLEQRNLGLIRSRNRIAEILKQRDEQWKNWIPQLSIYATYNKSLTELGNLSASDLNAAVIAPLTIPNPFSEKAKAFENSLSYLESKDSYLLNYRRSVVNLYQIFSRMSQIEESNRSINREDRELSSVMNALGNLESVEAREASIREIQSQLVQLLNLPGQRPIPNASTRPKLDYSGKLASLQPGKNYGKLAVRLFAYQIEATLLQEKGIKLRRWPNLAISASTPTLYDTNSLGSNNLTNTDRIALFSGLSKSYDILGTEAKSIKTAKENTEYVKQNLRLQMDQDSREFERLKRNYSQVKTKQALAYERLARIKKGRASIPASAELAALRQATAVLNQLTQTKEQMDLEIMVWDDDAWN